MLLVKLCCLARLSGTQLFSNVVFQSRKILLSSPFTKYLLLTNIAVGAFLDGSGDGLTQKLVEHTEKYDWKRTLRMVTIGMLFSPPFHYWYLFLEKWYPKRTLRHMVKKVGLDIFMVGPITIALFYLGMNMMEGKSVREGWVELKEKFWPTFKFDLVVWLPFQSFNFYYLPISLRLISANMVYLLWAMYLSYVKHNDISPSTSDK